MLSRGVNHQPFSYRWSALPPELQTLTAYRGITGRHHRVSYLHVVYGLFVCHTHCVALRSRTCVLPKQTFNLLRMLHELQRFTLFCFFTSLPQMVYNFPDESCFLISTVKGQQSLLTDRKPQPRSLLDEDVMSPFTFPPLCRWVGRRTPSNLEVVRRTDGITNSPPSVLELKPPSVHPSACLYSFPLLPPCLSKR